MSCHKAPMLSEHSLNCFTDFFVANTRILEFQALVKYHGSLQVSTFSGQSKQHKCFLLTQ